MLLGQIHRTVFFVLSVRTATVCVAGLLKNIAISDSKKPTIISKNSTIVSEITKN